MSESNSVFAVRIATVLSMRLAPKVVATLGKMVQYGTKLHIDGAGDITIYTKLDGSKPKMVENYPGEVDHGGIIPSAVRGVFGDVIVAAGVAMWRERYNPTMAQSEAAAIRKEVAKFLGIEDSSLKEAVLVVLRNRAQKAKDEKMLDEAPWEQPSGGTQRNEDDEFEMEIKDVVEFCRTHTSEENEEHIRVSALVSKIPEDILRHEVMKALKPYARKPVVLSDEQKALKVAMAEDNQMNPVQHVPIVRPNVAGLVVPSCPKCEHKMHSFYSKDGREFWGCCDRKCRGIRKLLRPINWEQAEIRAYAAYVK